MLWSSSNYWPIIHPDPSYTAHLLHAPCLTSGSLKRARIATHLLWRQSFPYISLAKAGFSPPHGECRTMLSISLYQFVIGRNQCCGYACCNFLSNNQEIWFGAFRLQESVITPSQSESTDVESAVHMLRRSIGAFTHSKLAPLGEMLPENWGAFAWMAWLCCQVVEKPVERTWLGNTAVLKKNNQNCDNVGVWREEVAGPKLIEQTLYGIQPAILHPGVICFFSISAPHCLRYHGNRKFLELDVQ